jgi:predicted nucleic-acid-binding protein
MIALDTNVLVRYLVEDDAAQSARAAKRIAGASSAGEQLFISSVVFCEVAWVLAVAYKVQKAELIRVLRDLLRARQLAFENADALIQALEAYERGRGDLADYVIRETALTYGCESIATFDKALTKEARFIPA